VTRAPAIRGVGLVRGPAASERGGDVLSLGRPAPRASRSRRATRECLLALGAVEAMLEDAGATRAEIGGDGTALLFATAAAYAASNRSFIEGGGSIYFAYTAPAVVPAEVAIEFAVAGPYAVFIGGPPATLRAIWQAAILLETGACGRALILSVEIFDECADLYARARRFRRGPLVEAAACLWLEPGDAGHLSFQSARERGARDGAEELFACAPLAALAQRRREGLTGAFTLSGCWRGERACIEWSLPEPITASARDTAP